MSHRVEYRISGVDVWALLKCDEAEGARCRMICPESCEAWPCGHDLVDAGYCNEIDFIGNSGPALEYREGIEESSVIDGEITIRWDGDCYVWSQEHGRAMDVVQTEDGYEVFCRVCDWHVLGVETLESAGHLGELHVGDEHFDA